MFSQQSNVNFISVIFAVGLAATLCFDKAYAAQTDNALTRSNQLVKTGKSEARLSKHFDAINDFSKAIKLNPNNHHAYFYRARSRKALRDFQSAVEDYSYSIKINPKSSKVYTERGWCLGKLDLKKQAIKDLNKAIALDSKNYKAYQYRSEIKYKQGDFQGALSDFNRVLKLKPKNSDDISKFLFPKLNLVKKKDGAKLQITQKNPDKKASLTLESESGINESEKKRLAKINNKAAAAIKAGKFDQAVKLLEPITVKHPDYDFARRNLTIALNNYGLKLARHNPEDSMDKFRLALFYTPKEATARRNLNAIIRESGKNPKKYNDRLALAEELLKAGNLKSSFVEYTEALRIRNTPVLRRKLAEVCLELENQKSGDKNSAPEKIASALKAKPEKILPATKTERTETEKIQTTEKKSESEDKADQQKDYAPSSESVPTVITKKTTPSTIKLASSQKQKENKPESFREAETTTQTPAPPKINLASLPLPAPAQSVKPVQNAPLKALSPRFSLSKEEILNTWSAQMDFAQKQYEEGDYIGAENSYDKALALAESIGPKSKELAMSLEKLAEVYLVHKKIPQAYSILSRALTIFSTHHEDNDPILLNIRKKLSGLAAAMN